MDRAKACDLVRWFAKCGDLYVDAYLSHIDVQRLATDPDYGLKLFFFTWAFERSGAPRAYRIAAVKAVSSLKGVQSDLPGLFATFCAGKRSGGEGLASRFWKGGVPAIDPKIRDFDVPGIVRLVRDGALADAFKRLEFKGMAHKLRAFFLRDIVTLLNAEEKLRGDREAYLWCQPVDVWVRFAAEELCGSRAFPLVPGAPKYGLSGAHLKAGIGIIDLSMYAGVSPLKVNQGIWYFSANAVADEKRLRKLISSGQEEELRAELRLMDGFLPKMPMWG